MSAPEGVPLDTESKSWQERKRIRTTVFQVMKEVAQIEKGLMPACNGCERAGDLLINGKWWCDGCHHKNIKLFNA